MKHEDRQQGAARRRSSPPVRGRGLKRQDGWNKDQPLKESPPVRGRGLKRPMRFSLPPLPSRPPCGGVD